MAISNTALTAPDRAAQKRAVRVSAKSPESKQYIRSLLPQTCRVTAPTATLAAYLGVLIVRGQYENTPEETVRWALAMFSVSCPGDGSAARTISEIASDIDNRIEDQVSVDAQIPLDLAIKAVEHELKSVFGNQLSVVGWLPGHKVANNGRVLELSGSVCPSCQTNPSGYKAGTTSGRLYCLNGEDCGWKSDAAA